MRDSGFDNATGAARNFGLDIDTRATRDSGFEVDSGAAPAAILGGGIVLPGFDVIWRCSLSKITIAGRKRGARMYRTVHFVLVAVVVCFAAMGCGGSENEKGSVIVLLGDEALPAGEHRKFWDQTTDSGDPVPPGIYGVWFTSGDFDSTAVFQIVADETVGSQVDIERPLLSRWYEVWMGSGAYVVGETVDVNFYIPHDDRVLLRIVKL
jgi:hypothetical protein